MDVVLVVVGVLGLAVAALSARIKHLPLSEPLIGLTAGIVLGPAVLDVLPWHVPSLTEAPVHEGSRILLAISVMAVALRYPTRSLRPLVRPVGLLLALVMPAMALVVAGLSAVTLGFGLASALLIGAALAPTDPVLASSVVTGKPALEDLPGRLRRMLSLESGANDGLGLPLVLVALAVAGPWAAGETTTLILWEVFGAVAVGLALGWLGARALRAGEAHGATEPGPVLLFTLLLALLVLGLCGILDVSGVVGVFVAGLAFNRASTGTEREGEEPVDDAVNRFLVLPVFVLFGAVLPWREWGELGWSGVAFALGVLLLRRLPAVLLMRVPLRLTWPDATYLGWFGPVGVAALFYLTMEADRLGVDDSILAAGALAVAASVVVHGTTAAPGRVLYRAWAGRTGSPADTRSS